MKKLMCLLVFACIFGFILQSRNGVNEPEPNPIVTLDFEDEEFPEFENI